MTLEQLFASLIQPLPGDETELQNVLRVLSLPTSPQMLEASEVANLEESTDLLLDTDFEGPWQSLVIAVKFTRENPLNPLEQIPNTEPKDFGFYLVMGDEEYALVEMASYSGTSAVLTDRIKLGPGDQIRVRANGLVGLARAEVRGERL